MTSAPNDADRERPREHKQFWQLDSTVCCLYIAQTISKIPLCMQVLAILACLILCVLYAKKRGVYVTAARLGRSFRLIY